MLTAHRRTRRDYPEGEVILGMEIRMHSAKAALVDTANAEFHRPGVTTYLDELSVQSVQEAVKKITNHYHWKGPCLLYTSPSPRDATLSRMPSSA